MGVTTLVIVYLFMAIQQMSIQAANYLVIGDWGDDNDEQVMVAQAMSQWCDPQMRGPCDFIVNTADNFYPDGLFESNSPRFNTTWKWVYDLPNIDNLVWYNSIGNHDYGLLEDRELNQLNYPDPLWYFPSLYYYYSIQGTGGVTIDFFVVDTMSFITRKHDPDTQKVWLETGLQQSTADWKIMYGHNPPYSAGDHAPGTVTMRNELVPLCNEYNVDIFFTGDDHNLEHITSANHTDYVISAAGGRGLYEFKPTGAAVLESWGLTVEYFGYHYGFLWVQMTPTSYTIEFVDASTLSVKYSYSRNK